MRQRPDLPERHTRFFGPNGSTGLTQISTEDFRSVHSHTGLASPDVHSKTKVPAFDDLDEDRVVYLRFCLGRHSTPVENTRHTLQPNKQLIRERTQDDASQRSAAWSLAARSVGVFLIAAHVRAEGPTIVVSRMWGSESARVRSTRFPRPWIVKC